MLEIREINEDISIGLLDLAWFSKEKSLDVKREAEKAGTKYLLNELLKTCDYNLVYTELRKPYLDGRREHISISHSHNKLAIILNKKSNTGIDIELVRDKVLNIQHKFLSEMEMGYAKNKVDKLLTIWAAKEAMYKVYGMKEVEFSRHLLVENFEGTSIIGRISMDDFQKKYELVSENIDNYKMVYVLNEL